MVAELNNSHEFFDLILLRAFEILTRLFQMDNFIDLAEKIEQVTGIVACYTDFESSSDSLYDVDSGPKT